MMLVLRAVTALFAAALPISPTLPISPALPISPSVAHSSDEPSTVTAKVTTAAWFQPDPLCMTPLGCGFLPLPALSPYPKGTFHIGTALGRQTARAYIGVPLSKRAQTARGGTLSIPLDTDPADGSVAPETSAINVCVIYQKLADVEGAFHGAPSPNCLPAAHAKYVAKPAPHLVANLDRLGGKLGGVKGFALLPADAKPTSAWQVVFKVPAAGTAESALPELTLLVGAAPNRHPTKHDDGAQHSPSRGGSGGGGSVDVPVGASVPDVPPTTTTTQPDSAAPVIAPARRLGHYVTISYQYPEVWLLPLVLVVLVPFTARAMTKDLTRRREISPRREVELPPSR